MPVYNTETYLEEAIESIINQTIGFEKNIQLILVNDGSKDNSEEICLKYKEKYPENIVYIKQENAGVSSARNKGMEYIEGEYVNFLDSDDKWNLDAFQKIEQFLSKNNKIDIVAGRMKFFEAQDDFHPLDYKFKTTKIVDILEDYNYIHLHITSIFIKTEVAKLHHFDIKQKYGEDTKYVNEIILEKKKYGVIREALHYYRKRIDKSSAVQNQDKSLEWYTDTLKLFYDGLIDLSINKYGKVIPYLQYLLMYDIQWRIKNKLPNFLNEDEKKEYIEKIKSILQKIEDYIICEQKNIFSEHKIYILSLKHNKDIKKELVYKKGKLFFNNILILNIRNNKSIFKIDILDIKGKKLIIEGRVKTSLPREDYNIYLEINNKEKILVELEEGKKSIYEKNTMAMDRKITNHYTYKISVSLKKIKKIRFVLSYKNELENCLTPNFERFSKLSNIHGSYYSKGKYLILYEKKEIKVFKNEKKRRIKKELEYISILIKNNAIDVVVTRLIYFLYKMFCHKEIWLISDREDKVDDNGEIFFKYLQKIQNKNIRSYFLINKSCQEYKKMKKIGKVIKNKSLKHKIYFLLASKIISSQANDYVINPFEKKEVFYRDLMNFKFVFLQHGITINDLSSWLKKYSKNIKLFVTASRLEYNSIINGDYYYTEDEVKLTGFPRFDRLIDKKQKSIIILPTHRRSLVEWNPKDRMDNSYNPHFKESYFYKFYNRLINDKRLIDVLKKNGYQLRFGLHPLMKKQIVDFQENDYVNLIRENINFQKEFSENSMLVTDYSSVVFDFAYLKKQVIYTQSDKDIFYDGQVYEKGYFDYEEDGFGPVCYDYESTVQAIIEAVENDCKLTQKYLDRINEFYAYYDTDNCKRVYEEILEL